ncbi:MAG: carotenoid oxygenase family protein [Kofleriaceae bacterium]
MDVSAAVRPDLRRLVALHLQRTAEEIDAPLVPLAGRVPEGLDCVWWRNGPGRFERGGVSYGHPFDGDGFIARFDLRATEARVRTRFVQTPEFLEEERADKILYRGFGTERPGGVASNIMRLHFKNAANTSVMWHAGSLHALWEGGAPTRIDPATLETLGRDDLGGSLQGGGLTPPTFSAHPRRDDQTHTLYNFGLRWGLRQRLSIYAIEANGVTRVERNIPLDGLTFIHDFTVTPNWFVFLLPAVRFDVIKMALGLTTPMGSLRSQTARAMTALLVPRDGGAPITIGTVPGFVFHQAGAFEDAAGRVVCDVMRLEKIPELDLAHLDALFEPSSTDGCAVPVRLILDPRSRVMVEARQLASVATELPITARSDGHPYRSFWATAASPGCQQPYHSSLVRIEPERGVVARCELFPAVPSEPGFVRRPDARHAEDGWLLTVVHRPGAAAELWILDAESLAIEARLGLPIPLPPGLHGCVADRAVDRIAHTEPRAA